MCCKRDSRDGGREIGERKGWGEGEREREGRERERGEKKKSQHDVNNCDRIWGNPPNRRLSQNYYFCIY